MPNGQPIEAILFAYLVLGYLTHTVYLDYYDYASDADAWHVIICWPLVCVYLMARAIINVSKLAIRYKMRYNDVKRLLRYFKRG